MTNHKCLDEYDWLLLAKLLSYSNNLKDCLNSLYKMNQNERILEIISELEKGNRVTNILTKNSFEKSIGFYCQIIDLSQAIQISYQKKQQRKKMFATLVNKASYPIVIYVSSIIVLSLFTDLVLPSMLSIVDTESSIGIAISFSLIKIIKNITLILFAVLLLIVAYLQYKKRWQYLWLLLHSYHLDSVLKMVATYQFVDELSLLNKQKIPLITSLELIRYDKKRPLAALIASQLHTELSKGKEFIFGVQNEFFDDGFAAMVVFGIEQQRFDEALEQYKQIVEERMMALINKVSIFIQGFSYLFVAIVVIVAYKVLLLPLELLNAL